MSRSIGDAVAAQVGVNAEPEIMEFEITPDDKFIVLASDGVWEFIDNDEVNFNIQCMRMIIPFFEQSNAMAACDKIVKESVANWKRVSVQLQEDDVVDDITIVIMFLTQDCQDS